MMNFRGTVRTITILMGLMGLMGLPPSSLLAQSRALVLEGSLVTMSERGIIAQGALLIRDGRIERVLESPAAIAEAVSATNAQRLSTDAWIFPGFINLHTHLPFNHQPLWVADRRFNNRYEWQAYQPYLEHVLSPQAALVGAWDYNLIEAQSLFSEVKALIGGTTSLAASPRASAVTAPGRLVRNLEYEAMGPGAIQVRVAELDDTYVREEAPALRSALDSGEVRAWLLHLAEGIDQRSRDEFERLQRARLLRREVVVVHGTGLTGAQLDKLGRVDGHLVWAPTSNLLLYGEMADVAAAMEAGVNVSLSNDWAPSGTPNLLAELKVAAASFEARYGRSLPARTLVEMITTNPARAIGWESVAGALIPDAAADIVVVAKREGGDPAAPYEDLVLSTEEDIELVLIRGEAHFGRSAWMMQLKPGDSEALTALSRSGERYEKRIDITQSEGQPTFAALRATLEAALRFDERDMQARFLTAEGRRHRSEELRRYVEQSFPGLTEDRLPPPILSNDADFLRDLDAMGFAFTDTLREAYRPFERHKAP